MNTTSTKIVKTVRDLEEFDLFDQTGSEIMFEDIIEKYGGEQSVSKGEIITPEMTDETKEYQHHGIDPESTRNGLVIVAFLLFPEKTIRDMTTRCES